MEPTTTVETFFRIEQLMGDKSWQPVMETMSEADYDSPGYIQFMVKDDAKKYIRRNYYNPESARIIRVVVTVVRTLERD